jgi:hypothetical protein
LFWTGTPLVLVEFLLSCSLKNTDPWTTFEEDYIGFWLTKRTEYSNPPNTEPSDIRMVIPRTQFVSGFQIASLDRLGMNKIFFMTLINKTV